MCRKAGSWRFMSGATNGGMQGSRTRESLVRDQHDRPQSLTTSATVLPTLQQTPAGDASAKPRVAIVGGGLAGLAAAVALSGQSLDIELFEARRQLGGRAASFRDPTTGEL